ncbi:kinase-like protein, partial [Piedraia hortae CBS 480.64]
MESNRLSTPLHNPHKERQIKDAQDMYRAIVRSAERLKSKVPPYDFIELIGKGGFGRVYKCREQETGQLVAVKIVATDEADFIEHTLDRDSTIESFRKEVSILQQLKDSKAKNVNMIHDAFDLHSQLWIVSDYCTGGSLRTLLRASPANKPGFDERYIIPIARELAIALKSVHDIGVIHRDIKCGNVYVNEEGQIQLGDFGIVGIIDDGVSKRRTIIGTPHWLPLEINKGMSSNEFKTQEAYGTEVDIWSYGITIYEAATGHPPNQTVRQAELGAALLTAPRLEGAEYSAELKDFVAFCLATDPKQRPTADQLLKHPYIANTAHTHPTSNLIDLIDRYAAWEYKGGQRASLWFAGGAAGPSEESPRIEETQEDWVFSTSDHFTKAFN